MRDTSRRALAAACAGLVAAVLAFVPASSGPLARASPPDDGPDTSTAAPDGPYVTAADGGGFIAKRIERRDGVLGVAVTRLAADAPTVEVELPDRAPLVVRLRPPDEPPACEWPAPEALFVTSDLEGNLAALVALLRAGKVVGDDLSWTYGKGHLVFVGDVFDRGLHVTECLWLLYELEARARASGGAVHFVLGNHEVMNLTGDLRYVRRKYTENAALLGEELGALHSKRTVLGRWLRTRNAVERIGDELFCHGGISPAVANAKRSLADLNDILRKALSADAWGDTRTGPLGLVAGSSGPLWYRGYFPSKKEPAIESADLDAVLAAFAVKRVVVGHTIVPQIGFLHGGRVLAIDVHHAEPAKSQAAVREKGLWFRVLPDGRREPL